MKYDRVKVRFVPFVFIERSRTLTTKILREEIAKALNPNSHPTKAEQLFYLLKARADSNGLVRYPLSVVHPHFTESAAYTSIKKLETAGAIQCVIDGNGRGRPIIQLQILKEEVSIPLGKRGRKPKTKEEKTPLLPISAPKGSNRDACVGEIASVNTAPEQKIVSRRTVVFIDENELIRAANAGIKFSLDALLEKLLQRIDGEIARVFIYLSEATERRHLSLSQSLFRSDNSLVRYIKTGSQPGVVDRRMREDIIFWSQIDFISTIVLATADGGVDFQEAIAEIKKSGKIFILLEAAGVFNQTLSKLAYSTINATAENPRKRAFCEIIEAANDGNFESSDPKSRFVAAVLNKAQTFFLSERESPFMPIVCNIYNHLQTEPEFRSYTLDDVREVLTALTRDGFALGWRINHEGAKVYFLPIEKSRIMEVLEEHQMV